MSSLLLSYLMQTSTVDDMSNKVAKGLYYFLNNKVLSSDESYSENIKMFMGDLGLLKIELIDANNETVIEQRIWSKRLLFFSWLSDQFTQEYDFGERKLTLFTSNGVSTGKIQINKLRMTFHNSELGLSFYFIFIFTCILMLLVFREHKNIRIEFSNLKKQIATKFLSIDLSGHIYDDYEDEDVKIFAKNVLEKIEGNNKANQLKLDDLKKQLDYALQISKKYSNVASSYQKYGEIYIRQISIPISAISNAIREISQRTNDRGIKEIISNLKYSVTSSQDIIKLYRLIDTNLTSADLAGSKRSVFNEVQLAIRNTHSIAESVGIDIHFIPNEEISGDIAGYTVATAFSIYFILQMMIEAAKAGFIIEIRTVIIDEDGKKYLQLSYIMINATKNTIASLDNDRMDMMNYVAKKFDSEINVEVYEHPIDLTATIEVIYKTRCLLNFNDDHHKQSYKTETKIGVFDQDFGTSSSILSSIKLSGFSGEIIKNLSECDKYDLVFVNSFDFDSDDHNYIQSLGIDVCSVERIISQEGLIKLASAKNISACLSYCADLESIRSVIMNFNSTKERSGAFSQSSVTADLLNRFGPKSQDKLNVVLLDNNSVRRTNIIALFSSDMSINICDISISSFKELPKIAEIAPQVILMDENYRLDGELLSADNFRDRLEFTGQIACLSIDRELGNKGDGLYDVIIHSRIYDIKERIFDLAHLAKQSVRSRVSAKDRKDGKIVYLQRK